MTLPLFLDLSLPGDCTCRAINAACRRSTSSGFVPAVSRFRVLSSSTSLACASKTSNFLPKLLTSRLCVIQRAAATQLFLHRAPQTVACHRPLLPQTFGSFFRAVLVKACGEVLSSCSCSLLALYLQPVRWPLPTTQYHAHCVLPASEGLCGRMSGILTWIGTQSVESGHGNLSPFHTTRTTDLYKQSCPPACPTPVAGGWLCHSMASKANFICAWTANVFDTRA